MNYNGRRGNQRLKRDSPLMVYLTKRMQQPDSRNELIRIALHGLLRRGLYSTSSLNTTATTSTIRQDSLDEYSHSEGEVVFPRDPVPVRYAPDSNSASDSPRFRSKASPGELSPTALRSNRQSSPGEINTRSGARRTQPNTPNGRVIIVTPGSPGQHRGQTPTASRDNSDSRSLHKSDLHHWGQPLSSSREGSPQISPRNERHQSPTNSSRGSDRHSGSGHPSRGSDHQKPVSRSPIHVPIPPMEPDDSSGLSGKGRPGYDQGDTSGDVSSISGGDF